MNGFSDSDSATPSPSHAWSAPPSREWRSKHLWCFPLLVTQGGGLAALPGYRLAAPSKFGQR